MSALPDLQRRFTEFVLSAPGTPPDARLCAAIRQQGVSVEERLAVHRNNVYSQLMGALGDAYPAVRRLIGEGFFRFMAAEYLQAYPPRSAMLSDHGKCLPGFLEGFEPARTVPYLPDVARLEQLYLESYHAAETGPIPQSAFKKYLSEVVVRPPLRLHPSARLMTSPFPISRIWEMNVQPTPVVGRQRVPEGAEYLLIVRPEAAVEVRRIARGAHAALAAIERGRPVSEAMAAGAAVDPDLDIGRDLLSLAEGGTFRVREGRAEPSRRRME
ncbi:MAG TPA: DNA-binding domain-containing protein [Woeseiaceae bacterium]|jgi:hypothetical protein|nr:DNA-binding domain-containing protein [Woeseiaceae bacterium]